MIITPGRSGSTFLARTLGQHPEIACEEEIFNRSRKDEGSFQAFITSNTFYQLVGFWFNREKLSTLSFNLPLKWLVGKFLSEKASSNYGFKISLDQLYAYPLLFEKLDNWKVIYLTREDKKRMVLSLLAARKTQNYERFAGEKVTLNPIEVKRELKQLLEWEEDCSSRVNDAIYLTSEALFEEQTRTLNKIKEHLHLKEPIEAVQSLRTHPESIADWIENYGEIEKYLQTTP